jgi:hypothetical protein
MAILDRHTQPRQGMSGEEFLQRWHAGEFASLDGDRPEVVRVAALIHLGR